MVSKTTIYQKKGTLIETLSSHEAVADSGVLTDVSLEVPVALLRSGVDTAPDLALTRVVDFGLVEIGKVETVHSLNLGEFGFDLPSEEYVRIFVVVAGVNDFGHVFPVGLLQHNVFVQVFFFLLGSVCFVLDLAFDCFGCFSDVNNAGLLLQFLYLFGSE